MMRLRRLLVLAVLCVLVPAPALPAPGGDPDSEDPAVAGPALFAAWRQAVEGGDGRFVWERVSRRMREELLAELKKGQERMAEDPEMAAEVKKRFRLAGDPATMPLEDLVVAVLGSQLGSEEMRREFLGDFGTEFRRARKAGDRLVVVAAAGPEEAADHPDGEIEVVHERRDGRWTYDDEAQRPFRSRLVESVPWEAPEQPVRSMFLTPDGGTVGVVFAGEVRLVPFRREGATATIPLAGRDPAVDFLGGWLAVRVDEPEPGIEVFGLADGARKTVVPGANARHLTPVGDGATLLAWVIGGEAPGIRAYDVTTGTSRLLVSSDDVIFDSMAMLAGGESFVASVYEGFAVYDLSGKKLRDIPFPEKGPALDLYADPEAPRFAFRPERGDRDAFVILDAATGEEVRRLGDGLDSGDFAFSPDGKQVALERDGVRRYDVATGKLLRVHRLRTSLRAFAFHPDGKALIGAGRGHGPPRLFVFSTE